MARIQFALSTEGEVALVAATPKTVLQLVAPANTRVAVTGFTVSFDSTSPTAEPVQVEIIKQSDAGTMSAATPRQTMSCAETIRCTGQKTATAEPTLTNIVDGWEIQPQLGIDKEFNRLNEIVIGGSERLAIRCTAPANVNCRATIRGEE